MSILTSRWKDVNYLIALGTGVVRQGMNMDTRYARRYHWLNKGLRDFVAEPHSVICCDQRGEVPKMAVLESAEARQASATLAREMPGKLVHELQRL